MSALALAGGDDAVAAEVAAAAERIGVAVLPISAADRAHALLVADSAGSSAIDAIRAGVAEKPRRPVIAVATAGVPDALDAMAAGARGMLDRPVSAEALRAAMAAAGALSDVTLPRDAERGGVVVAGVAGGVGTTTCAVGLAGSLDAIVVDLDLACGDAALIAGALVSDPGALLALTSAPSVEAAQVIAALALGAVRVLPAPELPEHADLIDESGVARVLDALGGDGLRWVVDAGSRVGVETVPALERAGAIALVASPDDRGARGAARLVGLIDRLGLGDVPCGLIVARCGRDQRLARALAAACSLPLWGVVPARRAIGHAAGQGAAPPAGPFARAAASVREAAA